MRSGFVPLLVGLFIFLVILISVGPVDHGLKSSGDKPEAILLYATSGVMPQLLNTSQIDTFLVWESVVSTTELGCIGKVIARESDIPPDHKWAKTACNVLVMRNEFITDYPEVAALLSAVTIAGMTEIQNDPDNARNITATWVYGSKPIRSAGLFLDPDDVENEAFKQILFTDSASLPDISRMVKPVYYRGKLRTNQSPYINQSVTVRARELLGGARPVISGKPPTVRIGYLPSSDLYAPLYVTIMEHEKICDTYGFCISPQHGFSGRPTRGELMFYNQTIAYIQLLPGQVGGGIMTGLGQNAMDVAYIGSVPSMLQVSMGNNASIVHSINAGGSGLVVEGSAPCTDWKSFVSWIRMRSAASRPVIIAVPQSSIQEEMIREALEYEGIGITLYGLPPLGVL